jgi:hypothetical protein
MIFLVMARFGPLDFLEKLRRQPAWGNARLS